MRFRVLSRNDTMLRWYHNRICCCDKPNTEFIQTRSSINLMGVRKNLWFWHIYNENCECAKIIRQKLNSVEPGDIHKTNSIFTPNEYLISAYISGHLFLLFNFYQNASSSYSGTLPFYFKISDLKSLIYSNGLTSLWMQSECACWNECLKSHR